MVASDHSAPRECLPAAKEVRLTCPAVALGHSRSRRSRLPCSLAADPTARQARPPSGPRPRRSSPRQSRQLVGAWSLSRIERRDADGNPLAPAVEDRVGYLIYDASGHMGVTLMRPGREPYSAGGLTADEALAQFGSYTSYFGRFSIDDSQGAVTHHLEGSLDPPRRRRRLRALLHAGREPSDPAAAGRRGRLDDRADLGAAAGPARHGNDGDAPPALRRVPHRCRLAPHHGRLRGRRRPVRDRLPPLRALRAHVRAPRATRPRAVRRRGAYRPTRRSASPGVTSATSARTR